MGLVFYRRLAIPLWAIALLTVALTAAQPATPFLMPPPTLFVITLLGIVAIIFAMRGMAPSLHMARSVVRAVPAKSQHKTSVAISVAAGSCVRTLDEPPERTADDALDLVRMDDDGGWKVGSSQC